MDTADAEQADVAFGTARDLAAVVLADRIRVAGPLRKRNPSLLVVDLTARQLGSNLLALVCIAVCEFHAFYLCLLYTSRFPPRRREVTACGGTFLDIAT